jgi:hypothetical protein
VRWFRCGLIIARLSFAGFPPLRPGFELGSCHVGFVVDKLALEQGFSEYFNFRCESFQPAAPFIIRGWCNKPTYRADSVSLTRRDSLLQKLLESKSEQLKELEDRALVPQCIECYVQNEHHFHIYLYVVSRIPSKHILQKLRTII